MPCRTEPRTACRTAQRELLLRRTIVLSDIRGCLGFISCRMSDWNTDRKPSPISASKNGLITRKLATAWKYRIDHGDTTDRNDAFHGGLGHLTICLKFLAIAVLILYTKQLHRKDFCYNLSIGWFTPCGIQYLFNVEYMSTSTVLMFP